MKIIDINNPPPSSKLFGDLKPGDVFTFTREEYMKIDSDIHFNAVSLADGGTVWVDLREEVYPVEAEVHVIRRGHRI